MNIKKQLARVALFAVRAVAPTPYLPPYAVYPGTIEHKYCLLNLELCSIFAYNEGLLMAVINGGTDD
jgi:hypothetical protein